MGVGVYVHLRFYFNLLFCLFIAARNLYWEPFRWLSLLPAAAGGPPAAGSVAAAAAAAAGGAAELLLGSSDPNINL